MTVERVLLKCPQWNTERAELISPFRMNNLKEILTTKLAEKRQSGSYEYQGYFINLGRWWSKEWRNRRRRMYAREKERKERKEETKLGYLHIYFV
jgi:hypothetical protein